jgi:hypothetical protein
MIYTNITNKIIIFDVYLTSEISDFLIRNIVFNIFIHFDFK